MCFLTVSHQKQINKLTWIFISSLSPSSFFFFFLPCLWVKQTLSRDLTQCTTSSTVSVVWCDWDYCKIWCFQYIHVRTLSPSLSPPPSALPLYHLLFHSHWLSRARSSLVHLTFYSLSRLCSFTYLSDLLDLLSLEQCQYLRDIL